ncbi:MAG: carboxymuconolactone decarboxylase family protein [Candidatus Omnitrophica bacterium]|nr:carboxymuconolactone decarboxylase family protein [Candidatus Omnitrophota bacterium]MCF7877530.1 carboxymuconolactone decarboxylase family protein [Candidatus Omnitrophota bacterium]MCF7891892.1 carboxymuconolactone decarboxylase family protein [Candidatus Omnitrophota bacterium]MCF7895438.1 carboxymuconolactone decarboxylase family protein [Candidatus Omnitrophota bacterium]MCF7897949.1 carboxymuconolactone decarboxylase family protein [Candidatus Omnitrophota bacterium]
MEYEPKKTLDEFKKIMVDIRKTIPDHYSAFINEKQHIIKKGAIPEKTKWLLLLIASLSQKCPVCVPRAVEHCLESGWTKEELLEASMVAVLVGGSSVMTYVTLIDKTIEQLKENG